MKWLLFVLGFAGYVQAETLHVGMLLPLTGSYAAVGADNRQGIEAALELSEQKPPVDIVYADSKADAAIAMSEFRKLVESDKIIAAFAMRGPVGMAINPISKSLGVPLLGGVGNKDFAKDNDFAYQIWSKSDDEGAFLSDRFKLAGIKRVAVLSAQDDWPVAVSNGYRAQAKLNAQEIIYDQEFNPTETDFKTAIAQIKKRSPEAIFANLAIAQIGPFLKQARDQKLSTPIYSSFWAAKRDVINSAGVENAEGVKFVEMGTNLPKFREYLKVKFNSEPSAATLSSYAATLLILQTIASNPNIKDASDFALALSRQTAANTPDGPLPIVDRCIKFPLVERKIHGGKPQ